MAHVLYASGVGSLTYAMTCIWLDISFSGGLFRLSYSTPAMLISKQSKGFFIIHVEQRITYVVIKEEACICVETYISMVILMPMETVS